MYSSSVCNALSRFESFVFAHEEADRSPKNIGTVLVFAGTVGIVTLKLPPLMAG